MEYDHSTAKFAIGWNAQTRAFGGPNNEFGLYYNTPSNLDSNAHELVIGGGTGSGGMTLFNSTSGQGNIFFADGIGSADAKKMGRIVYDHSDNSMQFTTNSSEAFRIDSSGRVLIGTTTEGATSADTLTIAESGNSGITIRSGTSNGGHIYFSDGTSGAAEYAGYVQYEHDNNKLNIGVNGSTAAMIVSSGHMGLGVTPNANWPVSYTHLTLPTSDLV